MNNIKYINKTLVFLLGLVITLLVSCEREPTDDVAFAKYPSTAEIFLDTPIGLGSDFYFPYLGSKPNVFSVDNQESYEGTSSIRIDVPNANDPEGSYAGAIFRIEGENSGRNLTEYDALTFWAKASQGVTINEIGFGEDFGENKYLASIFNVSLTTNWVKYIVPIPDPSKLIQERGMLRFSASGIGNAGQEIGYSFWLDNVKFEKLGTLAQPKPSILNGENISQTTFIGVDMQISNLTQTFNLGSGYNITEVVAPSYFTFMSSNPNVAVVNELGVVTVLDAGSATITAQLAGVKAMGSLTIESLGNFNEAPLPSKNAANVISVFSDAYTNVPVDYYNGFFQYQTTLGGAPPLNIGTGQVINYSELNFVGIGTFLNVASLDLTNMTHIHIDINVQEAIDSGDFIKIQLINNVGGNETSGSYTIDGSQLTSNSWVGIDVPLSSFSGLSDRNDIGLLFFISDATIANIFVDNIYYYKE